MTKEDALIILGYHSGRNPDFDNERWKNGFLGILRPYKGKLLDSNFIEIMECLKVLKNDFKKAELSRELIANINGIIYYADMWTNPEGMLQGVLTQKEIILVKKWISIISYCVICLLEDNEEAFYEYHDYIQSIKKT